MSSPGPESSVSTLLGREIRRQRRAAGLTQAQLATRLGCKQSAISRLEGGGVVPDIRTLARIAEVLGKKLTIEMTDRSSALRSGVPVKFESPR